MTLIDRTAYPRFKQYPSAKELTELYTPTQSEIKFIKSRVRSHEGLLCFMVMLKSFQRLGYFPHPENVPIIIIQHLRSSLKLRDWVKAIPTDRQRRNYQQAIREYLGVKSYDKVAQKLIAVVVSSAAEVKDHPADLINIAIEELVKERYELPTFNSLDRLVNHVRSVTNNRLFQRVSQGLSSDEQAYLDQLLMWRFYCANRKELFSLIRSLDILSTSADLSVIDALKFVLDNEHKRGKYLPFEIHLDFISNNWRTLVVKEVEGIKVLVRQQLEICVFSYLATEFKTGDACVVGSESYADFREQLLTLSECEPMIEEYCSQLGFPANPEDFVEYLRLCLTQVATEVDILCADGKQVTINPDGEPVLKRLKSSPEPPEVEQLEEKIRSLMPERSVLDILCNVEHWLNWTRHFGPISGSEPKFKQSAERYIFTTFGYGCNLGPNQTARHSRGVVTSHMISYTNRRHISTPKIEAAIRDIINAFNRFGLPSIWGTGKRAAADGSKFEIYENNLHSEYHIRYGGYGGIAYHHVSDKYIALFTHFITCGVWEAVYILDGLLKNLSDLQPDTLYADTQGQSGPVFAISYLLGIKLMPRIRNWKELTFLRPSADATYRTHLTS